MTNFTVTGDWNDQGIVSGTVTFYPQPASAGSAVSGAIVGSALSCQVPVISGSYLVVFYGIALNTFPATISSFEFLSPSSATTIDIRSISSGSAVAIKKPGGSPASGGSTVPGSASVVIPAAGLVKSTGSALADAVAGVDYAPPTPADSSLLKSDGSGGFLSAVAGIDYPPLQQFAVLPSAYTLVSQTALQKLLNTTPSGAITLQPGVYFFECGFELSGLSSTSGSFGFGFGGTATFTQAWFDTAEKPAFVGTGSPQTGWNTAANSLLVSVNTNTTAAMLARGVLTVTVAGTVIPQVSLGVAAAAVVAAGSYFRIDGVNSSASYVGAWS